MIPDYQTIMLPLLRLVSRATIRIRDVIESIADEFQVTDEERSARIPSGLAKTFDNRVHWAATYLVQAGLLERPKRGVLSITKLGHDVLRSPPERIDNKYLSQFPAFKEFKERGTQSSAEVATEITTAFTEDRTPEERIDAAYAELSAALRSDLLARIQEAPPDFFETLIVDLMKAMHYGQLGGGKRLGQPNDGGVDAIITEDALGLDVVYLQAKRYQTGSVIGIEKIQAFIGALVGHGANKGVFVTTSHFSRQAIDFAARTPQRLVLIDGDLLTGLMVRYKVGVRIVRSVDLMRLDADYFPADE